MTKLIAAGSVCLFVALAAAEDKKADQPVLEKGFTSLFNGKDLTGWHVENNGKFSVKKKEGVIFLNRGGGWLRSDKQYKDFELRLDFRFLNKGADSGIFIKASKEGKNWPDKNYQVQTMDNDSICSLFGPGVKQKKDAAKLKKVMKKTSHWQTYAITAKGKHLEVRLNGELINTVEGLDPRPGYIGLQGEGGQLEFKNIRIKVLKK
jgi:hypothetical protein